MYDYLDLVSFLSLEPNLPLRVPIVSYVHGGYLPNIMSTIRQSWKDKPPVSSAQPLCSTEVGVVLADCTFVGLVSSLSFLSQVDRGSS